jgi:uncharacterized protein YjbI with pentapeptide repeats
MDTQILPGKVWGNEIEGQIKSSDSFIVLLSKESVESDAVIEEVKRAYSLSRERGDNFIILPIRVEFNGELPYELGTCLNRLQHLAWKSEDGLKKIGKKILSTIAEKQLLSKTKEKPGDEETSSPKMESLTDADDSIDPRKRKYYDDLREKFHAPIPEDRKIKLLEIYVEPSFSIHKYCIENVDSKKYEDSPMGGGFISPIDRELSIHELIYSHLKGNNTVEYLKQNCKKASIILVMGYPGQGKSAFCTKTLYDLLTKEKLPEKDVYFFQCKDIDNVQGFIHSPLKVLKKEIDEKDVPMDEKKFKDSILILDGLDQLQIEDSASLKKTYDICLNFVEQTEGEVKNQKIIITCRKGFIDIEKLKDWEILILQLNEFTKKQQFQWVQKYKKIKQESALKEDEISVYHEKDEYRFIKELIDQPILMYAVAIIDFDIKDRRNRSKFYDKLFETVVVRIRRTNILRTINKENLRKFIRDIALEIFMSGKKYILKNDLLSHKSSKEFLEDLNLEVKSPHDSLNGIMMAFYFKEVYKSEIDCNYADKYDYAVGFLHQTLFNFMVAEKIWIDIRNFINYYPDKNLDLALEKISYLFSKQLLSIEIVNDLVEIIYNDIETNKEKLAKHLIDFFTKFLEKDFLWEYETEKGKRLLNTFYGFWTILSTLSEETNSININVKDKFVFILKSLTKISELSKQELQLNLSYQNLSETDLSEAVLKNANLNRAILNNANINGANLTDAKLRGAYLGGANLNGAIMVGTDLRALEDISNSDSHCADLKDAQLNGADIRGAFLIEADLSSAKLCGANLCGADLREIDLSGANLRGANLSGANLNEARLIGADLRGAELDGAYLYKVDLSETELDEENRQLAKEAGAFVSKKMNESGIEMFD